MALIPPWFADCVVAVGIPSDEGTTWIASGFLYAHYVGEIEGQRRSRVYFVTNRHVAENQTRLLLRFNPQAEEPAREYDLVLQSTEGGRIWTAHPDPAIDVMVVPINFQVLQEHAMQVAWFESETHVANVDRMRELGFAEGDFVYVLGFPMGLVGEHRNTVIVREGIVARIRDTLVGASQTYLVDSFVFPGNSGGPVISKPEVHSIRGTSAIGAAYLIGIIRAYVPFVDVAVSMQTRRPRVTFEENSGLGEVHPIDCVQAAIEIHENTLAQRGAEQEAQEAEAPESEIARRGEETSP